MRFIPMICIMGIIFYLSHQPGDRVLLPDFPGIDKLTHAIAYGSLAGAFLYGLQPFNHESKQTVVAVLAVLFCTVYGVSDEYHQSFVPGRVVSFLDVLADAFGALIVAGGWVFKGKR